MPLTETQKRHLIWREDIPVAIRKNNEFAVRKHLEKFLQYCENMMLILNFLPKKQLLKYLKDAHVFMFLDIAILIMQKLDFAPIEGKLEDPETWHIGNRPVEDSDIARNVKLRYYLVKLGYIIPKEDLAYSSYLLNSTDNPEKMAYAKAVQRVAQVVEPRPGSIDPKFKTEEKTVLQKYVRSEDKEQEALVEELKKKIK